VTAATVTVGLTRPLHRGARRRRGAARHAARGRAPHSPRRPPRRRPRPDRGRRRRLRLGGPAL